VIRNAALLGGGLLAGACTRLQAAQPGAANPRYTFPDTFLWGAGNAGLQHEGSPLADGASESMMYRWAHTPGKVPPGGTFDVSSDSYRRIGEDIAMMRELGLRAFNFEVYWPRVLPEGTGRINRPGLDYYDRLVDQLLEAKIVPLCNLYVFDHPQVLQDRGGWLNRDMAQWFADYGAVLFERLGDRVGLWSTIVETTIINHLSYAAGRFPPQGTDIARTLRALHQMLLGEGLAVQAFRASRAQGGQIGNEHGLKPVVPASDKEQDIAAAERMHAYYNLMALDSQRLGRYPQVLVDWFGRDWPADAIREGDLGVISSPMDFIGITSYSGFVVRHAPRDARSLLGTGLGAEIARLDDAPGPWTPESPRTTLRDGLVWLRDRYGDVPVHILEIGATVPDAVVDGRVDDPARISHIRNLLTAMHQAMKEGVDVRSCFVWALNDGWEFDAGLSKRYGLVHIDFDTQRRTIKNSGYWYRDLIRANGFTLQVAD
jgi:beta-glucosidase